MTYADPLHHSSLDDVQGLSLGVFLCGIGIFVLTSAGLITGQTAGLAVIIAYLTGYSFGTVFFLINLPWTLAPLVVILRVGVLASDAIPAPSAKKRA